MRQLNYYTASRADSHGDLQKVTFQTAAAVNKLFCLERALQIVDRCMQVHGAMGMTQEYPFEYLHRQLKSARAAEGSPQIMRHIVATDLLGKEITQLTPRQ
jgi:acyl-CoA dehydrogenase